VVEVIRRDELVSAFHLPLVEDRLHVRADEVLVGFQRHEGTSAAGGAASAAGRRAVRSCPQTSGRGLYVAAASGIMAYPAKGAKHV
jgi:hypothetical protein